MEFSIDPTMHTVVMDILSPTSRLMKEQVLDLHQEAGSLVNVEAEFRLAVSLPKMQHNLDVLGIYNHIPSFPKSSPSLRLV